MSDYFFNNSALIIIKNLINGLILSLPLLFGGIIKQFLFVIITIYICKYFYDFCRKNTIDVPLVVLLSVPLSGAFTGLCLGLIGIAFYYNIVLELSQILFNFIIATLFVLSGGIYLAFRLGVNK
jgi:hypothetical protein